MDIAKNRPQHPSTIKLDTVTSTNIYIKSFKQTFLAVTANKQTNGYGRSNNSWESESGNLFLSIILPKLNIPTLQHSLLASVIVKEGLAIKKIYLKWPNDIYYSNFKVGGILLEESNNLYYVGIGINTNSKPMIPTASSLKEITKVEYNNLDLAFHIIELFISKWQDSYNIVDTFRICSQPGKNLILTYDSYDKSGYLQEVLNDGTIIIIDKANTKHHLLF